MNDFRKLKRFPLGALHAEGFIKDQMKRAKDGLAGNLYKLEPAMIHDPYLRRTRVPIWAEVKQVGWGAEISANYWSGYIQYAYVLGDEEMIRTATEWVDSMLKMARPDGYLGAYFRDEDLREEDFNALGTTVAMRGLLAFYEVTGRTDVLEAVHRCMLWFCENWAGERKTSYAGPLIVEAMVLCYRFTGDERLIEFSKDYEEFLCRHDIFKQSYLAQLDPVHYYNSNHTAGTGRNLRHCVSLYTATGDEKFLRATENGIRKVRSKSAHVDGSAVAINEYLGPVSSTAEIEYCSFPYFNLTFGYMNEATGEAKYGDYAELMFYNGAQGARKKDEKAIAYLSAPNQVLATDSSASSCFGDMQVYAPCYPISCCPVNSVPILPEFVRNTIHYDEGGNIYLSAYAPVSLAYGSTQVKVITEYPFRDLVRLEVTMDTGKSLFLKIPEWAKSYTVTLDGAAVDPLPNGLGYVELKADFRSGRAVEITFRREVEVIHVDDTDASNKHPLAFRYGALVFSYHVPEDWRIAKAKSVTPLPEGWNWYNVYPHYEEPKTGDHYDNVGKRRESFTWSVAVDEDIRPEDIRVEERDTDGYVWEDPRIVLHLPAYHAPFLYSSYPKKTYEPYGDKQYVTYKTERTLVPYGCTNLRITYFPRADLKK